MINKTVIKNSNRFSLGEELISNGAYKEALSYFLDRLKEHPTSPLIYNNLGIVLHHLGKQEEALNCFRKGFELDPGNRDIALNLGEILISLGKKAEALIAYQTCLLQTRGP